MSDSAIKDYIDKIPEYEGLTAEQEYQMILQAQSGDLSIRNKLVEINLRLVVSVAKNYQGQGIPILDLIQEGNIGLITAIEKFDCSKKYRLSTYAIWWIRHYITKALSKQCRSIRLPANIIDETLKLNKVRDILYGELERPPTLEELSIAMGMPVDKIKNLVLAEAGNEALSIDLQFEDNERSPFSEIVPDKRIKITENLNNEADNIIIKTVLDTLNERESFIISERYGLNDGTAKTLESIGKVLGLSKERVRQIEKQALSKLRNPARKALLRECL